MTQSDIGIVEKRIRRAGEKLAAQMGWEFQIVPWKLADYRTRAKVSGK